MPSRTEAVWKQEARTRLIFAPAEAARSNNIENAIRCSTITNTVELGVVAVELGARSSEELGEVLLANGDLLIVKDESGEGAKEIGLLGRGDGERHGDLQEAKKIITRKTS